MRLFRRHRSVARQAAEWLVRVSSGNIGSRADRAWSNWMSAHASHQRAYEAHELLWELSAQLRDRPAMQALLRQADAPRVRDAGARGATRGWLPSRLGRAALMLLGIGVGALSCLLLRRTAASEYATATGKQRAVTLADNSMVYLNTRTRIRARYSRRRRIIELLQGEAFFAAAHDGSRPFEVHALGGVVTALGTQFNVRLEGDRVSVSVLEGTVAVSPDGTAAGREPLAVGQALDYARDGISSGVRPARTARIRGWQARKIVFNDVPLEDALRDYNRYVQVPIVLATPELARRHVSGVFQIGDETAFLGALRQSLRVKVTATTDRTVLQ